MRIDADLYLVWCDSLDIDEAEAHQVEAATHAEAVELVCQSLWDCDAWTAPPNTVCEVGVCHALGAREEKWFFASLRPTFEVVEIQDCTLGAYRCSGTTYHLPACSGSCGEEEESA